MLALSINLLPLRLPQELERLLEQFSQVMQLNAQLCLEIPNAGCAIVQATIFSKTN